MSAFKYFASYREATQLKLNDTFYVGETLTHSHGVKLSRYGWTPKFKRVGYAFRVVGLKPQNNGE